MVRYIGITEGPNLVAPWPGNRSCAEAPPRTCISALVPPSFPHAEAPPVARRIGACLHWRRAPIPPCLGTPRPLARHSWRHTSSRGTVSPCCRPGRLAQWTPRQRQRAGRVSDEDNNSSTQSKTRQGDTNDQDA